MPSILFVCTANQFRSPLAAALLTRAIDRRGIEGDWTVESAGTWAPKNQPVLPNAQTQAVRLGLPAFEDHRSRSIDRKLIDSFDLILVMEAGHKEALRSEFKDARDRICQISDLISEVPFDIADPVLHDADPSEVADELARLIEEHAQTILNKAQSIHADRSHQIVQIDLTSTDLLKKVLENLRAPDQLESHPWAHARFVEAYLAKNPEQASLSSGTVLILAVASLFAEMIPSTPPKRGKRIDTQWGKFGILAAQYFAPLRFNLPYPVSLRDAWGKIDRAILLFQFGDRADQLSVEELSRYKLVGDELDVAPISTLSDWNRKGIEQLAGLIDDRTQQVQLSAGGIMKAGDKDRADVIDDSRRKAIRRWIAAPIVLILIVLIALCWKGWRIYQSALPLMDDARQLKGLINDPSNIDKLIEAGPALDQLRADLLIFKDEAYPALKTFGPWLEWVPAYGHLIAASADLIDMADHLTASVQIAYHTSEPILQSYQTRSEDFGIASLVQWLVDSKESFTQAKQELDTALEIRQHLNAQEFAPQIQDLLVDLDAGIGMMSNGLALAIEAPDIVGAGSEGPKTYLLLVQNEDELRPTGGFITAAGTVVLNNGTVNNLNFENSSFIDRWDQPYPPAPWQMRDYMNIPVMTFRDTNWFTNYPKAALYAETLYSYANAHSVDGVIAFDQQTLIELLRLLGAVQVEGVDYPIDSGNVVEYMRQAKIYELKPGMAYPPGWSSKNFMTPLAHAIVDRIYGGDIEWIALSKTLIRILNERHVNIQLDNEKAMQPIHRLGWDGSIQPRSSDFLMAVDTNIGYNKTNSVIDTRLAYVVDLSNLAAPVSEVSVLHTNGADPDSNCSLSAQFILKLDEENKYLVDSCYWDYLRIYVPEKAKLLFGNPQQIPAEWMLTNVGVEPRIDLVDEDLNGVKAYGLLKVVKGSDTVISRIRYVLPMDILQIIPGTRKIAYRLHVQKQPGTDAIPLSISVQLPTGVILESAPPGVAVQDQVVNYETNLKTDANFEIIFSIP